MKPLNRRVFFDCIRTPVFAGALTPRQVDGLGKILDYRETHHPSMRDDAFAYVLATVTWETGHAMQPVPEGGSAAYLRAKRYYPWFGRGLVQCTWEANYRRYGCANNPEPPQRMLEWDKALVCLFDGVSRGVFTGKKLDDYFAPTRCDFTGARAIINGKDRAAAIAAIAECYLRAIARAQATLGTIIHASPVATAERSPAELPAPPTPATERPQPPEAPPGAKAVPSDAQLTRRPASRSSTSILWSRAGRALAQAFFHRKD